MRTPLRTMMAAAAISVAAATTLAAPARAEVWFGTPAPGFGYSAFPPYQSTTRNGPNVVGFGDDWSEKRRRYWGGPAWAERAGYHPPYQSYRFAHRGCRDGCAHLK